MIDPKMYTEKVGLVLIITGINDNNHTISSSSSNTSNIIVMRMSQHPHNHQ